ncbi:MAG: hypothetical protein FWB73_02480 [Treponema sp.]|nr:hypothetical protein [Treponema sp.]
MKYDSEIIKAMHQEAKEMHKIGVISDARMCEYDEMCLDAKTKKKSIPVFSDENNSKKIASHATA